MVYKTNVLPAPIHSKEIDGTPASPELALLEDAELPILGLQPSRLS